MNETRIEKLIDNLSNLPGFGKRTATKLTMQIINLSKIDGIALGESILDVVQNLKNCSICGNICSNDICQICSDLTRDKNTLMIVANFTEIDKFEITESYNGYYHVLGGVINPLEGIGPSSLNLNTLKKRLIENKINEVILAFGLSTEAETTLFYIQELIKEANPAIKITRLAQGIPAGSEIEYLDRFTLKEALDSRKIVE